MAATSHCHVHLTHPFVASWSLLEALACQCPMVVSDVAQHVSSAKGRKADRDLCGSPRPISFAQRHWRNCAESAKAIDNAKPSTGWMPTPRAVSLEQWSHVAGLKLTTNH